MDYLQILQKLYPDNSKGGQCAVFCENLVQMPLVGKTIWSKRAAIAAHGTLIAQAGGLQVGDVIITSDGLLGHVAFVNSKPTPNTSQLSESNWNLNFRIHHNRVIPDNYRNLIGVFRNCKIKFPVPIEPTPWITNLRIKLVMNHQPDWPTIAQHAYNIISWFFKNSGSHIYPVIDYVWTDFSNWPTKVQPDTFGGNPVRIIDEQWFDQNILPLAAGFDAVFFVMPKKDWTDTVIDNPQLYELGYAYEYAPQSPDTRPPLPMKALIALDEFDDYAPYYSSIGGFGKYVCHELCHLLYGIACNNSFPLGTDMTHVHFYGMNNYPMWPEDVFQDFDYQLLRKTVGH